MCVTYWLRFQLDFSIRVCVPLTQQFTKHINYMPNITDFYRVQTKVIKFIRKSSNVQRLAVMVLDTLPATIRHIVVYPVVLEPINRKLSHAVDRTLNL